MWVIGDTKETFSERFVMLHASGALRIYCSFTFSFTTFLISQLNKWTVTLKMKE